MTKRIEITRTVPLLDYEIDRSGDGRTVVAYAAVFNTQAEIRDHDGHYDEQINPAAFNKVLARSGSVNNVQVHYNHGLTLWGTPSERYSMPVGTAEEIKPDGRGLLTRTRYAKTPLGDEVLQLWIDGAIRGQSFRGATMQSRTVTGMGPNGRPVIERLQLGLREYGPTPNPAYADAGLVAIRSQLLEQYEQLTDEERAELASLLAESPVNLDPQSVPAAGPDSTPTDVSPVEPPAAAPDPGLSELDALANANRRRRTELS
jgi:HK97 family phage prohead protease